MRRMPWLEAVRRSITRLSSRVFCSTRGSLSERSSASERPASSSCNGSRVAAREMQYARSTSSSMSLCVHETIGLAAVVTSAQTSTTLSFGRAQRKEVKSGPCTTAWQVAPRCRRVMKPSLPDNFWDLCRRTRSQTLLPAEAAVKSPTSVQVRSVLQCDWIDRLPNGWSRKLSSVKLGTSGPSSLRRAASSRSFLLRSFSSSLRRFSSALAAFFASFESGWSGVPLVAGALAGTGAAAEACEVATEGTTSSLTSSAFPMKDRSPFQRAVICCTPTSSTASVRAGYDASVDRILQPSSCCASQ
mmetsp:Transcript_21300/g.46431  ORF Transcript_21300/g.46431 Transcript_21300/m.46431 type:complete len:302 (+) Transcript_21300:292-1197(+)